MSNNGFKISYKSPNRQLDIEVPVPPWWVTVKMTLAAIALLFQGSAS